VVSVENAAPRMIAAVHANMAIRDVPATFGRYLDQVYAAAKAGAVKLDGQNIFVYRDAPGRPGYADVAFGVGLAAPFTGAGNVQATPLPLGEAAHVTHRGSYAGIGAAHNAIKEWCNDHGRHRVGVRWEIYGHWTDNESELTTDIFHLLAPA